LQGCSHRHGSLAYKLCFRLELGAASTQSELDGLGNMGLAIVLSFLSAALIAWKSPPGRKAYVVLLHFAIVLVVATASWYVGPPLGRWVLEKSVLGSRRGALVGFSKKPSSQDGGPGSPGVHLRTV